MKKLLLIICLSLALNCFADNFKPQIGDLLFQDLDCGTLCNGINKVTHGVNNTYMSHVAIVYSIKDNKVIVAQANSHGVVLTPLAQFLNYSHDKSGHPMVLVERLKPQYQYLIPGALTFIHNNLGKPYNNTFIPNNNQKFYCSELIYKAFLYANNGKPIFKTHAMDFNDPKTHKIAASWQDYFNDLHSQAPQGLIGTNPGMMSRDPKLTLVYQYGILRIHSN